MAVGLLLFSGAGGSEAGAQGAGDGLLTQDVVERLGPPLPRERLVHLATLRRSAPGNDASAPHRWNYVSWPRCAERDRSNPRPVP